jgi:hypothetical protein
MKDTKKSFSPRRHEEELTMKNDEELFTTKDTKKCSPRRLEVGLSTTNSRRNVEDRHGRNRRWQV